MDAIPRSILMPWHGGTKTPSSLQHSQGFSTSNMSHRFTKYTRILLQNHTIDFMSFVKCDKNLLVGIMPRHFVALYPQQPSPWQIVLVPDNNRPHVFTNSEQRHDVMMLQ